MISFLKKKHLQALNDDLQSIYNDANQRQFTYFDYEKQSDIQKSYNGWKSLHSELLYKLNKLNKSYNIEHKANNNNLTNEEDYFYCEIKNFCDKAKRNITRLETILLNDPNFISHSPSKSLMDPLNQQNNQSRRMLHTLRSPNNISSSSFTSNSSSANNSSLTSNNVNRIRPPHYNSSSSIISKSAASKIWQLEEQNKSSATTSSNSDPQDPFKDFTSELVVMIPPTSSLKSNKVDSLMDMVPPVNSQVKSLSTQSKSFSKLPAETSSKKLVVPNEHNSPNDTNSGSNLGIRSNTMNINHHLYISGGNGVLASNSAPTSSSTSTITSNPKAKSKNTKTASTIKASSKQIKQKFAAVSHNPSINESIALKASKLSVASQKPKKATASTKPIHKSSSSSKAFVPAKKFLKPDSNIKKKPSPSNSSSTVNKSSAPSSPVSSISNDKTHDKKVLMAASNANESKPNAQSVNGGNDDAEKSEKDFRERIISEVKGIDKDAAMHIFNEIVEQGDEVHWDDIAGLEEAKKSLKEAVVYPFLRPDLFSGLREPTRGMLLFGPPGTGKTMIAKAVATESKSTFFSISASSLTSKYLGESEKLVRALFLLAKKLSPSIVFVDEIDSILSARSDNEHESSRRIKTEFLIQWNDLSHSVVNNKNESKEHRVLVLAATNLPWNIDEAARRRFVRRQYIPLPESNTRKAQFKKMLASNVLSDHDLDELVALTEGFSGSDISALTKDAAMNPLRELGDKLLDTPKEEIRDICLDDFKISLTYVRPSVSSEGLAKFEDWAAKFGSSGA